MDHDFKATWTIKRSQYSVQSEPIKYSVVRIRRNGQLHAYGPESTFTRKKTEMLSSKKKKKNTHRSLPLYAPNNYC